jgi:sulfotransferase family protein
VTAHSSDVARPEVGSHGVRLVLTGTPRSGNSWTRLLLGDAYACESFSVHSPDEVPWEALPDDVVVQIHQHAEPALISMLAGHGFRVVVLARHPLDVLISILHFARHDPSPARWLDGEGGDETAIASCNPLDPAFLEYATGRRAQILLGLSREWWTRPETLKVRYEDLCANVAGALQALAAQIGPPRAPLEHVAGTHTLVHLRRSTSDQHVWQGRPGHWRTLLPAGVAQALAEAHRESIELFGYDLEPDPELDMSAALENWRRIERPGDGEPRDWLSDVRATDARDIRALRKEHFALQAALDQERAVSNRLRAELDALRRRAAAPTGVAPPSARSPRYAAPLQFLARLARGAGRRTSKKLRRAQRGMPLPQRLR